VTPNGKEPRAEITSVVPTSEGVVRDPKKSRLKCGMISKLRNKKTFANGRVVEQSKARLLSKLGRSHTESRARENCREVTGRLADNKSKKIPNIRSGGRIIKQVKATIKQVNGFYR